VLVQELYMDAEYRERTSSQMRETIIKLEQTVARLQHSGDSKYARSYPMEET
jgi:hypothetical protein